MVGTQAARMAVGMGANVTILDRSLPRLRELDTEFDGRVNCVYSTVDAIELNGNNTKIKATSIALRRIASRQGVNSKVFGPTHHFDGTVYRDFVPCYQFTKWARRCREVHRLCNKLWRISMANFADNTS